MKKLIKKKLWADYERINLKESVQRFMRGVILITRPFSPLVDER